MIYTYLLIGAAALIVFSVLILTSPKVQIYREKHSSSPVRTDEYTVPLMDVGSNPLTHGRTRWYRPDHEEDR